jgi:hypothetical protein
MKAEGSIWIGQNFTAVFSFEPVIKKAMACLNKVCN